MPAAGQFVNGLPPYEEGDDETTMCAKCLQRLEQGSLVSLGGFGGYITVGFDSPILNHQENTISEYSAMHLTVGRTRHCPRFQRHKWKWTTG